jgi:hypothetical protein
MSDPNVKGIKRPSSRHSTATAPKGRGLGTKSARPKPLVKRSAAEKAPARKAAKSSAVLAKSKTVKKLAKPVSSGKTPAKSKAVVVAKPVSRKSVGKETEKKTLGTSIPKASPKVVKKPVTGRSAPAVVKPAPTAPKSAPVRQPTLDESAALRAFERAHKEFTRGRFVEARNQFRALVDRHSGAAEVTARARTYLAIAEARLRTESTLPRDADSLYDRGVIELNRGEYVAAQELFERAQKHEPQAAHIHYGLAATRARLGAIRLALESLERALRLQPNLRVRAQHDHDFTTLRNDPDFERLVFTSRF